jgi:hypothetical protein
LLPQRALGLATMTKDRPDEADWADHADRSAGIRSPLAGPVKSFFLQPLGTLLADERCTGADELPERL